ncbi:MAG: GNAT family N-acetyltransferase [Clostridiaceae bacterium]|nr:GNAT family N-acetyltransferase [Clostridiaceae bacterium]
MEIRFERAKLEDAELILQGQQKSFLPLLERYQDHDVNPCNEKLESIQKSIVEYYFYKIFADEKFSGAIYVHENPDDIHFKLHTIYVLPEYQNLGIGQKAIEYVEKIHSCAVEWVLETPHDLKRNHHLYEKMGYVKTGKTDKINDNLTIVHFKKKTMN